MKTRLQADDINGAWVIMPTPATPNADDWRVENTVDLDETARIVERLIQAGVNGILSNGTFGECATLTWEGVDGEIHCTSNVCTHQLALLTDGFFEADVVECPLHGGSFNVRTGAAMEFPCTTPLRTYPVIAVGEDLYVEFE